MAQTGAEGSHKLLDIRKYANRRYYDSTHSRHLTLEEIRAFIQKGYDICITDGKTGADITAQTLTQLILELDTPKLDSLPVPLLVRIIRMNDQLVKDFIDKYFNQALQSFLQYQQEIEDQLRRTHGLPSAFPSLSLWTKAMLQPITGAFPKPAENPTLDSVAAENARLKQSLSDLELKVRKLSERQKQPRGKAKRGKRN